MSNTDDLSRLEKWAAPMLAKLQPAERRQLARSLARELRKSQQRRITKQQNPDGSRYVPAKKIREPVNKPIRFYYKKTARMAEMKSYADCGDRYTGYDLEAGAIRTFVKEEMGKHYPPIKSGGMRSKQGRLKRKAMFVKLRQGKNLRTLSSPNTAAVGFLGRVARIAKVHQFGLESEVSEGGIKAQYQQRQLLGFSEADFNLIETLLIQYLSEAGAL